MSIFQIILSPFVWLLMFFYNLFSNYGIALILFAFVVKLILFPFSLKGKRSMIQMNMLQGKMQQLQKQYGKDKERYNTELQKLYEKEKVNPMSGCLWSFIPLLVLLPLYAIIRQPLTYMMGLNDAQILQVASSVDWSSIAHSMGWIKTAGEVFVNNGYNQLFLASLINEQTLPAVIAAVGEGTKVFALNFQFIGLDMSQIPQVKFWVNGLDWGLIGLFLMPIISAVSGFLFSLISMKTNAVNNQSAAAANNPSSKMMLLMSPIMSLWIGFVMPAGLCIYWIAQNVLSMLQEFICGKMLKKDYEKAALARAEQEQLEKEEEKQKKQEVAEERNRRIEESKSSKGKKKPVLAKTEEKKEPVNQSSRVGMRNYARGRAYDPNRYSEGPTPYREPSAAVDETAVEKALKKKSDELEEAAYEVAADDAIMDALDAARPSDKKSEHNTMVETAQRERAEKAPPDFDVETAEAEPAYETEYEADNDQEDKD